MKILYNQKKKLRSDGADISAIQRLEIGLNLLLVHVRTSKVFLQVFCFFFSLRSRRINTPNSYSILIHELFHVSLVNRNRDHMVLITVEMKVFFKKCTTTLRFEQDMFRSLYDNRQLLQIFFVNLNLIDHRNDVMRFVK